MRHDDGSSLQTALAFAVEAEASFPSRIYSHFSDVAAVSVVRVFRSGWK